MYSQKRPVTLQAAFDWVLRVYVSFIDTEGCQQPFYIVNISIGFEWMDIYYANNNQWKCLWFGIKLFAGIAA